MKKKKEKQIPFVAVGADELSGVLRIGDKEKCPSCGKLHVVHGGKNIDGVETDTLLCVSCPKGGAYLVGIAGKRWKK